MKIPKQLEIDAKRVEEFFPKLKLLWNSEIKVWSLDGELDICDTKGKYWNSFEIIIFIPTSYPHGVPIVKEKSNIIPREIDRHISEDGTCCIDIHHKLIHKAKMGINLFEFISNLVYPYFANQLYYNENGYYAGEEYKHHFKGIEQFYSEYLSINEPKDAILILQGILYNRIPERNDPCLCGNNKKHKKCHMNSVNFLSSLDKEILQQDLLNYKKILRN